MTNQRIDARSRYTSLCLAIMIVTNCAGRFDSAVRKPDLGPEALKK